MGAVLRCSENAAWEKEYRVTDYAMPRTAPFPDVWFSKPHDADS